MARFPNSSRSRAADLAWGIRNGVGLTAIVLIPAGIASISGAGGALRQFGVIAAAYLAFGAMSGLVVGLARGRLAQKSTAVALGALVGAVGFSLLMGFADPQGSSRASLIAFGAALGVPVGAILGWWAWKRAGAWKLR